MADKSEDGKTTVNSENKPSKKTRGTSFIAKNGKKVLGVILILVLIWLAYGYVHTKNELNKAKNPETAGKTEIEQIENQIEKVVALPANETPTLATVSNADKLKSQIFFRDTQNGDKVLIYSKSGTAILYRPSTKKVIEFAPVNLGNNQ